MSYSFVIKSALITLMSYSFNVFKEKMTELLYQFAKFQYECGFYAAANEYLNFYRYLIPNHPNHVNAMWGKLASEILLQFWHVAKEDVARLRSYINNNHFNTELELLQQRAWLIHWNLWIAFNEDKGRDEVFDMCLTNQTYLNVLQVLCPHIIRYVAVAVVTSRKQFIKDLPKFITLEVYNHPRVYFIGSHAKKHHGVVGANDNNGCVCTTRVDVGCRSNRAFVSFLGSMVTSTLVVESARDCW